MADDPTRSDASAFLEGDRSVIDDIRAAIFSTVNLFAFPDDGRRQELVQEALTRVFLGLTTGRFDGRASLRGYAKAVAKYTCLEHFRRQRLRAEIDLDELPSEARWSVPEEEALRREAHQRNLRAFAALPSECRELFRMIFLERLSYRGIARRLGVSVGAIKSRVRRCRLTGQRAMRVEPPGSPRAAEGRTPKRKDEA